MSCDGIIRRRQSTTYMNLSQPARPPGIFYHDKQPQPQYAYERSLIHPIPSRQSKINEKRELPLDQSYIHRTIRHTQKLLAQNQSHSGLFRSLLCCSRKSNSGSWTQQMSTKIWYHDVNCHQIAMPWVCQSYGRVENVQS